MDVMRNIQKEEIVEEKASEGAATEIGSSIRKTQRKRSE